jgi:catechol 2,3-dioxygenase-like lactoylglutathione lyase family enzyme
MITGHVHAGITVSDLEKSISFYRDILGFKLISIEPVKETRANKLGVPGAVIQVAVMEYGDGRSLELIQYMKPPPPNSYSLPVNALGQIHMAFQVDDIKRAIEVMAAKGVEFIGGNDYNKITDGPLAGCNWVYFKDPDGANLELIEWSKP